MNTGLVWHHAEPLVRPPRSRNRRVGRKGTRHLTGKAIRSVRLGEGFGEFLESVGDRLYRLRYDLGVSADELAAACGVHVSVVHRWESNTGLARAGGRISLRRLVQVAKALGVLPIDLLPSEEI